MPDRNIFDSFFFGPTINSHREASLGGLDRPNPEKSHNEVRN